MRVRRAPTERGKGVQYFINVEFVEFYERWDFMGRLGGVVLDALLYRERFKKPTGYVQRIRWRDILRGSAMNIPRAPSSLERAPCPSKDKCFNTVIWCSCRTW